MVAPLYYFGPVSWYAALVQAESVTFDVGERFVKRSWRSRCRVCGSNGPIDLSIPLRHPIDKQPTNSLHISYAEDWQKNHWFAIRAAYGRSPWFDYYGDLVGALYEQQPKLLIEWNTAALELVNRLLNVQPASQTTTASPLSHIDMAALEANFGSARKPANSDLQPQLESYIQVFSDRFGFVQNLSVLDVLFNLGPEAAGYLRRQSPLKQ